MLKRKFQVFVSSTFVDLQEERQTAVEAILGAGQIPAGMELFRSGNQTQLEVIKNWIDESDIYCLILGGRYGTMEPESGQSYTELEYRYAVEQGIPVFAVVLSDAFLHRKQSEDPRGEYFELYYPGEYSAFKKYVKSKIIRYADDCKDITNIVQSSLYEIASQPEMQARGWVRCGQQLREFSDYTDEELERSHNGACYELIRRNGDLRAAYDFFDATNIGLNEVIQKQTYLDKFDREVILTLLSGDRVTVSITTKMKFNNIKPGIVYYQSSPRFDTQEQASSYRTVQFMINGKDLTNQIESEMLVDSSSQRQFSYLIKNRYNLPQAARVHLVHRTVHECKISSFFQAYQLIFPCRDFSVRLIIKNNEENRYAVRMAALSSFNVHTSRTYETGELENNDVVSSIAITSWALPGSGYVASIRRQDVPEVS